MGPPGPLSARTSDRMSEIFDALRRSEVDRVGAEASKVTTAADLLEIAEQRVVRIGAKPGYSRESIKDAGRRTDSPDADESVRFPSLRSTAPSQSKLVCISNEGSLAAEKFRFLSVRLQHIQQRKPLRRLLITSSSAEEGKSFVAANLACALARRQEQRVLLVDGDLRRPAIAPLFGVGKVTGLTELLQGRSDIEASIYELDNLGFWLLPAGNPAEAPLELMPSRELSSLMDQLDNWFDWIVIDSPPLLPLGDTTIWMRLADGILLATRPGKTEKRHLERGLEAIEQAKLIGSVINGSSEAAHAGNYYYASHKTAPRQFSEKHKIER